MSESTSSRISRRTFIVGAGAGAAAVGLGLYTLRERWNSPLAGMPPEPPLTPVTPVSYGRACQGSTCTPGRDASRSMW